MATCRYGWATPPRSQCREVVPWLVEVCRWRSCRLVGRGLDVEQGVLVVLDGSKALRAAADDVFGPAGAKQPPFELEAVKHGK
jgi:hypothetical protein